MTAEMVLEFEREWWQFAGAKEAAIRSRFQVSPTRYYQQLRRVLQDDDAVSIDPQTVARLRRMMRSR